MSHNLVCLPGILLTLRIVRSYTEPLWMLISSNLSLPLARHQSSLCAPNAIGQACLVHGEMLTWKSRTLSIHAMKKPAESIYLAKSDG